MSIAATPRGYVDRPRPSGLADVVDIILDKGMVIDIYVRVALIGIEILTIDARIVIASVDTYLRFAEAVNRLDITETDQSQGLPQLIEQMTSGGAESKTKGALEGVKDKLTGDGDSGDGGALSGLIDKLSGDDDDDQKDEQPRRRSRSSSGGGGSSSRSRSSSSQSRSRSSSGSGSKSRSRKGS